jgi:TolA-binding protein
MARRITRKEMKHDEFVETAVEAGAWLEQNWPTVAKAAAGVVVVALLVVAFLWYGRHNREQAVTLLAQGMERYQEVEAAGFDDPAPLEEALGLFEKAADRSSSSPAGQSARYYQGVALYRLGRPDEATAVLEELAGEDPTPTLRGSATILLAETLAAQGEAERAIALLEALADDPESAIPPDQALLRLGHVYRLEGDEAEARRIWERIRRDYPQSAGAAEVGQLLVSP